jgi:hypothetical protein
MLYEPFPHSCSLAKLCQFEEESLVYPVFVGYCLCKLTDTSIRVCAYRKYVDFERNPQHIF